MKCWICGEPATTGEHRVKASDLKMLFPDVTQKTPIYTKDIQGNPVSAGSLKSDKLKFVQKICHECNTTRTQPYDFSWEILSERLQEIDANTRKLKLSEIFPGSIKESMLNAHLYFLKFFGCMIADHDVPIDLAPFAKCIIEKKAHPHFFLGFSYEPQNQKNKALVSPIQAIQMELNGVTSINYANIYYILRKVLVDIAYLPPPHTTNVNGNAFHPKNTQNVLHLGKIKSVKKVPSV